VGVIGELFAGAVDVADVFDPSNLEAALCGEASEGVFGEVVEKGDFGAAYFLVEDVSALVAVAGEVHAVKRLYGLWPPLIFIFEVEHIEVDHATGFKGGCDFVHGQFALFMGGQVAECIEEGDCIVGAEGDIDL